MAWLVAILATLICATHAHMSFVGEIPNGNAVLGVRAVGHHNRVGGGQLSSFGYDFQEHNYRWGLELCLMDSDGDGETNGMEPGDPCCEWDRSQKLPRIKAVVNVSHPGVASSRTYATAPLPFDHVSPVRRLSILELHRRRLLFQEHGFVCPVHEKGDEEAVTGLADFMDFYQMNSVFAAFLWAAYPLICSRPNGGVYDAVWKMPMIWRSSILAAAVGYTEIGYALVHIVLDNANFVTWPGIGPIAKSFQDHHDDPYIIVRLSWTRFLTTIDTGMWTAVALSLYKHSARTLSVFTIFMVPTFYLMQATHRWTHCAPRDVPKVAAWLQQRGTFLPPSKHGSHHTPPHNEDFSLFMGWSNPVLNWALTDVMDLNDS